MNAAAHTACASEYYTAIDDYNRAQSIKARNAAHGRALSCLRRLHRHWSEGERLDALDRDARNRADA